MRPLVLSILLVSALGSDAQPGALDPNFGNAGKVLVPSLSGDANDQARTGVILPDDRILVVGRSGDANGFHLVLLRFNSDGSTDQTFGEDGVVEHYLVNGTHFPNSCALDAQGRLVVVGTANNVAGSNSNIFISRFLADGTVDPSFNGTGTIIRDLHDTPDAEEGREVMIQDDGRIVVCGFTGIDMEFTEILIERYLDNGEPDPSFGGDGSVLVGIFDAHEDRLLAAALGPNGHIYFTGSGVRTAYSVESLLLGHVDPDGSSPSTFGNANGHSWVSDLSDVQAIIGREIGVQPNGNIVVAGVSRISGSFQARTTRTFDPHGEVIGSTYAGLATGPTAWNALAITASGAVYLGGDETDDAGSSNWHVDRFSPMVSIDHLFSTTDYDEDGGSETCHHIVFFSDSTVLGIGRTQVEGSNHIVLLKYLTDMPSSLSVIPNRSSISAYPNPAMDRTTVIIDPKTKGPIDMVLFDAQGRAVRRWSYRTASAATLELDLMGLLPGMYALQLKHGVSTSSLKLAKQ